MRATPLDVAGGGHHVPDRLAGVHQHRRRHQRAAEQGLPCRSSATAARTCWRCSPASACCSASRGRRARRRSSQRIRSRRTNFPPPNHMTPARTNAASRRHRVRRHGRASLSRPGRRGANSRARRLRVTLLISPKDVDQQAVKSARGMEVVTLPAVALQRGSRLAFLRGFWQSWRAARKLFNARRPDAVLAMGGFTSAPPVLAARRSGRQNFSARVQHHSRPGQPLARALVDQAFVGFPETAARLHARQVTVTGTPCVRSFNRATPRRAASRSVSTPPVRWCSSWAAARAPAASTI